MKLLILSNRYYFVGLLAVSLVGGVSSYFLISSTINKEFNKKLFAEKEQLIYELHAYDLVLENLYLNIGDRISLQKEDHDPKIESYIKDTILFDFYEKRELSFRQITFSDQVNEDFYKITISKSLLPSKDLIKGVTKIVALITFLFFITMLFLNNIISKKIWKPFYDTLEIIKSLNITKPKSLSFSKTRVLEFKKLNSTIEIMTTQMVKDYKNLKEYTENTSHEIQTPLAIIRNKIELLMQNKSFSNEHLTSLNQIHQFTRRLSKLNDNLSLLSKIDNNQFIGTNPIHIGDYIKKRLEDIEELLAIKNIDVTIDFKEDSILEINETMAYLLFSNLISNAIKHNHNKGKLLLQLTNGQFIIKNTGKPLKVPATELFERFKKSGNLPDSTGLGLSLAKRIAAYYNFNIKYTNKSIWHTVILKF